MVLDLMGIPTDLPLYDSQGNLISDPLLTTNLTECDRHEGQQSTEQEQHEASALLSLVRGELSKIDDIGSALTVSDEVNIYESTGALDAPQDAYYSVIVHGGLNGHGLWSNYLKSLSELLLRLEAICMDVWVRKIEIDTADDVFSAEIAMYVYTNQLS